ncbi:MAG: 30S ribosomal protein S21 [Planctomycetota bacterium]|nr:30S ribosomal protein S21 [Planctomycetota bacterium]
MPIRVKSRGNETAEQMLRRFKKLCEREGITKDLKRRQYHEKPSEIKRREEIRGPQRTFTVRPDSDRGFGGAVALVAVALVAELDRVAVLVALVAVVPEVVAESSR